MTCGRCGRQFRNLPMSSMVHSRSSATPSRRRPAHVDGCFETCPCRRWPLLGPALAPQLGDAPPMSTPDAWRGARSLPARATGAPGADRGAQNISNTYARDISLDRHSFANQHLRATSFLSSHSFTNKWEIISQKNINIVNKLPVVISRCLLLIDSKNNKKFFEGA